MADDFKVVCEVGRFQKNAATFVVARLVESHGVRCGDIRAHAASVSGDDIPTKGGLMLQLPQVRKARDLLDAVLKAADDVWGAGPGDAAKASTQDTREEIEQ